MLSEQDVSEIAQDFPILQTQMNGKPLAYLDNAATTQKPKQVIDRISTFYSVENANVHRGLYKLSQDSTLAYEEAHKEVGSFIGAQSEEIIFTRNTTESLNLLSHSLPALTDRKEIVLTELEHHSNLVPWQQLAKRNGLSIKFIPITDSFSLDYEKAADLITENTAFVSFGQVSNALGTINDSAKLCNLAKKAGAFSIIDGAQGAPHTAIDVSDLGCDFYSFSAHKMLGPTGIGALYGRAKLLEEMPPFNTGGDMIRTVSYEESTWNDLPSKFEAGTPNVSGALGFLEAINYLKALGMDKVSAWEKELYTYAVEKLEEIDVDLYRAENSAGIISFNVKNVHAHDVCSIADLHGVCLRGGHHCAMPLMDKLDISGTTRASFYVYNTHADVDQMITALKEVQQTFR